MTDEAPMTDSDVVGALQEEPLSPLAPAIIDRYRLVRADIARWEPRPMPTDWTPPRD